MKLRGDAVEGDGKTAFEQRFLAATADGREGRSCQIRGIMAIDCRIEGRRPVIVYQMAGYR
ncbi:MAG: hypothetical protein EOP13_14945 [Pseudomonas sp.]|uniref:hypothetical protein n=1 Tax=Pseudomonas sp. TaxID=306 RepID=UPI0011F5524C|nr:hypothetical protein [Pseudomonas sp.]RZI72466.1 MAG: hypothetical protein EOP13_14945 [Pseudomonas sp.]